MFAIGLLSFTLGYLSLVLIGSHECFQGTIIERWHYALTDGVCDAIENSIEKLCGRTGVACLATTERFCCRGSNPVGQIFFVILFSGCFLIIYLEVFSRLPVDGWPKWHVYTGTAAAIVCLALFLLVSYGDPGIVTETKLASHCALYPPDGILFQERFCSTCKTIRPARAKHCNAAKRCVARFDHWCIWVNAPIGLYNTRWFLAFLLSITLSCFYGAAAAVAIIRGDMTRHKAWDIVWLDPKTGKRTGLEQDWRLLGQYLSAHYGAAAGMAVFMWFAGLIVAGFVCLQVYRIIIGVTTNESWKWKELHAAQCSFAASAKPTNLYNRGWRRNFAEILMPVQYLDKALKDD